MKLYRGTLLCHHDCEQLKNNQGKLLSPNGFWSTSRLRSVALDFAFYTHDQKNFVSVLFEIECDMHELDKSIIVAQIMSQAVFKEEEVLFGLNVCFRIESIKPKDQMWVVKLTVSNENQDMVNRYIQALQCRIEELSIAIVFGKLMLKRGQYDQALAYFNQLLLKPNGEDMAWIEFNVGVVLHAKAEWIRAGEYYDRAYNRMMTANTARIGHSIYVLQAMGVNVYKEGKYEEAMKFFNRVYEMRSEYYPLDHRLFAKCLSMIGLTYHRQGKYVEALQYHQQSLDVRKQYHPSDHISIAISFHNIAETLTIIGKYDEAFTYSQKAIKIREEYYPSAHIFTADSLLIHAVLLCAQGKLDEALEHHTKALQMKEKILSSGHIDIAWSWCNIAGVLHRQGKNREALALFHRTLVIQEKVYTHGHLELTLCLDGIGHIYYSEGDCIQAFNYYLRSLRTKDQCLPADHLEIAMSFFYIGQVKARRGNNQLALQLQDRSQRMCRSILPLDHPTIAEILNNLQLIHRHLEQSTTAGGFTNKHELLSRESLSTGTASDRTEGCIVSNDELDAKDKLKNLELFTIVWFNDINHALDNRDIQQQLRAIINNLKIVQSTQECHTYIEKTSRKDRLVLIINHTLGRDIVTSIHNFEQVTSIYIYCSDKQNNEEWICKYGKVKAVISEPDELASRIKVDFSIQKRVEEPFSINMFITSSDAGQSTIQERNQFVFSQILMDCLLRLQSNDMDRNELIACCTAQYKDNGNELANLYEFEQNYTPSKAIYWYTRESFFYNTLNAALHRHDIHMIFLYRSFISDIYQQLQQYQSNAGLTVYRGQLMSHDGFSDLAGNIGQFVSVNSFLFTSTDREKELALLGDTNTMIEQERVLFVIDADSRTANAKPFADINEHSYCIGKATVLFMCGSIFRLNSVHGENGSIWLIRMTLCGDNEPELKPVFTQVAKKDESSEPNLGSLGKMLFDMGHFDLAEKCYCHYINGLVASNDPSISSVYEDLAEIASQKGNHEMSMQWQQKSVVSKCQTSPIVSSTAAYTVDPSLIRREHSDEPRLYIFDVELPSTIISKLYGLAECDTTKKCADDILTANPPYSFIVLSNKESNELILSNSQLIRYYHILPPEASGSIKLTTGPRLTQINSIEHLASELYNDIGRYYRDKAYQALCEDRNRAEIKNLLGKAENCFELLTFEIESYSNTA